MPTAFINPVLDSSMTVICKKPYYNHKHGCPNYGQRETCPPIAPELYDYFDITEPIYAVWVLFDLKTHREKMRSKHPRWSKRQLDCCLYWQGSVLKELREHVERARRRNDICVDTVTYVPEAMGVNVTATMGNIGVKLEWPPENIAMKIAFVGTQKDPAASGGNRGQ